MDIVKERADAAERELERIAASFSVASDGSGRSARVISTCSDVSVGSDEVFDGASPGVSPGLSPVLPGSPESPLKRQVIQKDWDVSNWVLFCHTIKTLSAFNDKNDELSNREFWIYWVDVKTRSAICLNLQLYQLFWINKLKMRGSACMLTITTLFKNLIACGCKKVSIYPMCAKINYIKKCTKTKPKVMPSYHEFQFNAVICCVLNSYRNQTDNKPQSMYFFPLYFPFLFWIHKYIVVT